MFIGRIVFFGRISQLDGLDNNGTLLQCTTQPAEKITTDNSSQREEHQKRLSHMKILFFFLSQKAISYENPISITKGYLT